MSFPFIFLLFTGIVGILIVFLRAFTAHPITAPNWNILWANPLNLFVIPFYFQESASSIHQKISEILSGYPGYSYTGLGHCSASRTHGFYLFDYPDDLSVFQTKK